jgi:hypothetical protein
MNGILKLLAKANLIELSDEEKAEAGLEALEPPQPDEVTEPPAPSEPSPLPDLLTSGSEPPENRPFEEIYAIAGLQEAPFSAEKLLRLLEGLRTMDAVTRKAAVLAMDAADDNWQISECIDDAERKIAVLANYKQQVASQVQTAEQQSVARIAEIRSGAETASSEIRTQIAELEQLLEREITKAAQETTGRESRRIDTEMERLREITTLFKAETTAR